MASSEPNNANGNEAAAPEPEPTQEPAPTLRVMSAIARQIAASSNLRTALDTLAGDICTALHAELVVMYRVDAEEQELSSWFATDGKQPRMRLPLSSDSVPGYVAINRQAVRINDRNDAKTLAYSYPGLKVDAKVLPTRKRAIAAVMAFPIMFDGKIVGVLEIANCTRMTTKNVFTDKDYARGEELTKILVRKLRPRDETAAGGAYEGLVQKGLISATRLAQLQEVAVEAKVSVGRLLLAETDLAQDDIGACLEEFYQVPYVPYDPD